MPSNPSKSSTEQAAKSKEKYPPKSSKHRKDHSTYDSTMKSSTTSPQNNTSYQPVPGSYGQTAATKRSAHSQYQARSLSGLPSARVWPDGSTVPSRTRLDYDLLGLNHDVWSFSNSVYNVSAQSRHILECPYNRTLNHANFTEEFSEYGLAGLDRFLAEKQSAQGAVYSGENVSHRMAGMCYCEKVVK